MINKKVKKETIIEDLKVKSGFSKSFCKKLINDLIQILILNIKSGNLNLKNIGTFTILKKSQRIGRNPKTMVQYIITSRKSLSFKISKNIINQLKFNE